VGAPCLFATRWLAPVIALGVRALPRALAATVRPEGTVVRIAVDGDAGGRWSLVREAGRWSLRAGEAAGDVRARVSFEAASAARLWYSGRAFQPSAKAAAAEGDAALCQAVLSARAVMV
jgi:hypothetical protein